MTDRKSNEAESEAQAAFLRIHETARQCSAILWGEKPVADINKESLPVALSATAMIFFLTRMNPEDVRAFYFGSDSMAPHWRPLRRKIRQGHGVLPELFGLATDGGPYSASGTGHIRSPSSQAR